MKWFAPLLLVGSLSAVVDVASLRADEDLRDFPRLASTTDWPWWRGPWRNGHAHASAQPPTTWSETEHVIWKVPVPGRGHASPIVVGEQIFLATADESNQTQAVVAFNRADGRPLWKTEVSRGGFPRIHHNNTHASPTAACDGERVIVLFHHHDTLQATALKLDGKIEWSRSLGEFHPRRYEYGYGASPVMYRGTVLFAAEYDGDSFLTALDRRTGNVVWRTPRPENVSYSSPSITTIAGRDLLSISGGNKVSVYDPADGKPLWDVDGTSAATCGTIVADGDILFASGGYPKAETVAVRASGTGEVLWKNAQKCYEQSMVAQGGYLYALTDNGGLFCFRGRDGREMWRQRLQGPVSASPVLANGLIYWANERGTLYVFRANPDKFEPIAENQLGDESFASPAVVGNRVYLRTATGHGASRQEHLYCLGDAP
jgi:outer membrane protein assembly factor BamB